MNISKYPPSLLQASVSVLGKQKPQRDDLQTHAVLNNLLASTANKPEPLNQR